MSIISIFGIVDPHPPLLSAFSICPQKCFILGLLPPPCRRSRWMAPWIKPWIGNHALAALDFNNSRLDLFTASGKNRVQVRKREGIQKRPKGKEAVKVLCPYFSAQRGPLGGGGSGLKCWPGGPHFPKRSNSQAKYFHSEQYPCFILTPFGSSFTRTLHSTFKFTQEEVHY